VIARLRILRSNFLLYHPAFVLTTELHIQRGLRADARE
jgi:hypothetical protein